MRDRTDWHGVAQRPPLPFWRRETILIENATMVLSIRRTDANAAAAALAGARYGYGRRKRDGGRRLFAEGRAPILAV